MWLLILAWYTNAMFFNIIIYCNNARNFLFFLFFVLESNIKVIYLFLLYFFPLPFSSIIPHSHPAVTTLLSMPMSPFCSIPPPSNLSAPLSGHPLLYQPVSILLVSSVCSFDSTYEWNQMIFVFLWLPYFTWYSVLQDHLKLCQKV